VLFVCTGNAGRSQIAEALFSRVAGGRVVACSGGVAPWDHLHPVAVRLLHERGIETTGRHPKHVCVWSETPLDWVVTIGDRALAETPRFACNPTHLHWDLADPADADGSGQEEAAFRKTLALIEERLPDLCERVGCGMRPAVAPPTPNPANEEPG
jgi:protein-tyrosine-phosphatase